MKRTQRTIGFSLALALAALFCGIAPATTWAQHSENRARQLSANQQGTLNEVRWNESELVIDGKVYRFDPETVAVFYRNREWTLVSVQPDARISFQIIDDDYVVAIWVERDKDMAIG